MAVNLEKGPDYEPLLQALIEKTKARKLAWHETADEDTFLSAVKGERTFELTLFAPPTTTPPPDVIVPPSGATRGRFYVAEPVLPPVPIVRVRNGEGKLLFEIPSSPETEELYDLARRITRNVDENIDATRQLLEQL